MNDARLSARSECYGTALRKASRRVTALYDETLAPSGLRSTQFAILAEIVDRDEGPPTLNQLADDLDWTARDSGIRSARLTRGSNPA